MKWAAFLNLNCQDNLGYNTLRLPNGAWAWSTFACSGAAAYQVQTQLLPDNISPILSHQVLKSLHDW